MSPIRLVTFPKHRLVDRPNTEFLRDVYFSDQAIVNQLVSYRGTQALQIALHKKFIEFVTVRYYLGRDGGVAELTKKRVVIFVAPGVVALLIAIYWYYFSQEGIPHQTVRLHLRLTASSIYEFHDRTGRWPTSADDLAGTSLPQISPHWKTLIEDGTVAIVWRSDLKPDPKDNAAVVMTYNRTGLFPKLGRLWVCWGDLRTEYVKEDELRSKLAVAESK